jgi:hypothetical protein
MHGHGIHKYKIPAPPETRVHFALECRSR